MKQAQLPDVVYRVGRAPDPWAFPDWAYSGVDGTFGNRFDDPLGVYRVLYASSNRVATFVETLARFRPDPAVLAELHKVATQSEDHDLLPGGVVPSDWLSNRMIGSGQPTGRYVDLGAAETLAELRPALASRLIHYGIADLDAAAIRLSVPRRFTQEVSRYIFGMTVEGARRWDGIGYLSRLGDDIGNWAFFEPDIPDDQRVEPISADDPDLRRALDVLGLQMQSE